MFTPMIIWRVAVAIVLLLSLLRLFDYLHSTGRKRKEPVSHHQPLAGTYKERDILYIPGDPKIDDNYDDFEDL